MPNAFARLRVAVSCCAALLALLAFPSAASAATIRGTAKADKLVGSATSDTIRARGGRDIVDGAGGADTIYGGTGNDRIRADGYDRVAGGRGRDRVLVTAAALSFRVNCGPGKDRLTIAAAVGVSTAGLRRRAFRCERVRYEAARLVAPAPGDAEATQPAFSDPVPLPVPIPLPLPTATPTPTPSPTPTPTPTPPPSGPANRFVAANGNDAGSCTQAAPCRTFARAYALAAAGDVIQVAAGSYPIQTLPEGTKAVTFRGSPGNKVFQLDNSAHNVTFDGLDVDAQGANTGNSAVFENHDANYVTFKNGRLGNVRDRQAGMISGSHVTFDNVYFHDAVYRTDGVHMECVYAIGVPFLTVRNSTFHNCAIMDLFFAYGSWWPGPPPSYGDVTIENNMFEHVLNGDGGWNYYPLYIGQTGDNVLRNWTVRYNTFEQSASVTTSHDRAIGSRWVGNIGNWDCISGMAYSHNVGQKCGTTDKAVTPAESTPTTPAPFGWVNPQAGDFHLRADSVAVDAGDPADKPATDRDGKARTGVPDAGAYER